MARSNAGPGALRVGPGRTFSGEGYSQKVMRSVFLYTLARLALFGATAGVLFIVGARGFLLLALAVLLVGIVSFVLLSRQRDAISASVPRRAARLREGLAEGAAREDVDDEEASAET